MGPILKEIGVLNTYDDRGVSRINLTGYSPFGRSNGDVGNQDNAWHIADELNYSRSTHNLKFGAAIDYRRGWHLNSNAWALGDLTFNPTFSAQLGPNQQGDLVPQANTGNSWADFLLGIPATGRLAGLRPVEYRGPPSPRSPRTRGAQRAD